MKMTERECHLLAFQHQDTPWVPSPATGQDTCIPTVIEEGARGYGITTDWFAHLFLFCLSFFNDFCQLCHLLLCQMVSAENDDAGQQHAETGCQTHDTRKSFCNGRACSLPRHIADCRKSYRQADALIMEPNLMGIFSILMIKPRAFFPSFHMV